jgi:hypothetical protein
VTLAALNHGFRVRLGLRVWIGSGLRPRRPDRLRIQPATCVWAVSTRNRSRPWGRLPVARVWPTLDLNHRSSLAALLEVRCLLALRSQVVVGSRARDDRGRRS